ncbi:MAG: OmpH family outer membrane protein [Acidobacteria bacterium]|nr:MAG: OmpH family outer membrane protein [Acidobacteriota bacterium]REJ98715.1 MAG: OmpH family outer membrane protein [Acidobacteriota bacterium]REK16630.1 MAG: OmpH family outer membrane protein [Acidobacteriota bacterium]REK42541.1 MAG: OmpH family outer membrane protein [Acidobacteriota bacterium]
MKVLRLFAGSLIFSAIFAASAFAQATETVKIGVINPFYFEQEQGGIAKYINALKSLDNEFKPDNQKLQTLVNRINALKTEIETLQKQNGTVPVKAEDVNKKIEEHNRLARELEFQKKDAEARFESRQRVVMGPLMQDIGKAMQEYANQNGFSLILDASKLDNAGLVLAFDRKLDVTQDFIKFYNARPAGTASANQ